MIRTVSRALSVVAIGIILWKAWLPTEETFWYAALSVVSAAFLIWSPETVDDWAFGTWRYGNTIDSHTPPVLIAMIGWVLLLVYVMISIKPDFISNLFVNGTVS